MKQLWKSLCAMKGFTLVELMVVVGIIGILSSIAVPNFKKYQAKAKTSEAKLALASVYTLENAFMSDYDSYGTCLAYMGYDYNAAAKNNYYMIGFNSANTTANAMAITNGASSSGCDANGYSFAGTKAISGATVVSTFVGTTYTVPNSGAAFTAGAEGAISTSATTDKWTIDQSRALKNVAAGY